MSDLPKNWTITPLGSLLSAIVGGGTPSKANAEYFHGTIPFMTVKDLHQRFIEDTQDHITQQALEASASTLIPADTLIVASRMSLGKIARNRVPTAINQDLKALFVHDEVDKTYVEYVWCSMEKQIKRMGTGTTVKGIRLEDIRGLEVPLAPRNEQARIVDQLDRLLARAQACKRHINVIPALLKRFRQAVLRAATEGSLIDDTFEPTNGNWTKTIIGEIAEDLRYGTSKKCGYESKGKGVLRIPNIAQHGRIDVSDLKRADFDDVEIKKLSLREGDLLVIRSNGSVELVGKIGLVTTSEVGLLFAGYLIRLRVDPTKARPEFIQLWLSAPAQRQLIERTAKSTSGVNNLNAEELRSFPVSLPSLEEQDAIINRVKTLFDKANYIEAQLTNVRAHAQRLIPLLLDKAFRGELVPQDPSDEPAEALLARIAAQRANAEPKARKPRVSRAPRAPKETAAMTKSRQDDDVKDQPYLAGHLRRLGAPVTAETLFKMAELPVADFYKQLAWEVAQGYVNDSTTLLEQGHAT